MNVMPKEARVKIDRAYALLKDALAVEGMLELANRSSFENVARTINILKEVRYYEDQRSTEEDWAVHAYRHTVSVYRTTMTFPGPMLREAVIKAAARHIEHSTNIGYTVIRAKKIARK